MDITEFLHHNDADLQTVLAHTQAKLGLEPTDVLLAVGSLVEGLGNSKSDLDLLLITPREASTLPSHETAVVVGKSLSDIQTLQLLKLDELLARFDAWAALPWDVTHAVNFTPDERRLLHRLLHCSLIFEGEQSRVTARLPSLQGLARLKLHVARQMARAIQVDMVGNREVEDYRSLVFAAQELLGHAVDALAAGYHHTNPTAKWRSRILEWVPSDWERALGIRRTGLTAAELFWRLHRAPEQPDRRFALEHSFRIAVFARAVFVWAERRLLKGAVDSSESTAWPCVEREAQDVRLPYLDLDVDFFEEDDQVSLARLNEFDDPLELSLPEFAMTLLFDGVTTAREAEILVCGAYASEADQRLVDRVISRIDRAGLSARL